MSNHVEIAKTIQSQIVTIDNMALFAWGAKKFTALPETNTTLGGLQFVVNGLAFKGIIVISLNGSDLYEIEAKTKSRIKIPLHSTISKFFVVRLAKWLVGKYYLPLDSTIFFKKQLLRVLKKLGRMALLIIIIF